MFHDSALTRRGAMSIDDFCDWAQIGRTLAYQEINAGRLKTAKIGRRRLVSVVEAQRWLEQALTCRSSETDALSTADRRTGQQHLRPLATR